jgi:hypothetical protein
MVERHRPADEPDHDLGRPDRQRHQAIEADLSEGSRGLHARRCGAHAMSDGRARNVSASSFRPARHMLARA